MISPRACQPSSPAYAFQLIAPDAQWNWSGKVYSLLPDGRGDTRTRAECQSGRADMAPEKHPAESVCAGASCPGRRAVVGSGVQTLGAFIGDNRISGIDARHGRGTGLSRHRASIVLELVREEDVPDGTPWTVICIAAVPYALVHALSYSGGARFHSTQARPHIFTAAASFTAGFASAAAVFTPRIVT